MTDTLSAQDEARRKLADKIDHWAAIYGSAYGMTLHLSGEELAAVRAALRAEPARGEEMRERCAKTAEADRGVDDCPYSNDKPGDPTWHHTDDDVCPRCRKVGKDSGSACVGIAKHRIAAAIRALPASHEGGGE